VLIGGDEELYTTEIPRRDGDFFYVRHTPVRDYPDVSPIVFRYKVHSGAGVSEVGGTLVDSYSGKIKADSPIPLFASPTVSYFGDRSYYPLIVGQNQDDSFSQFDLNQSIGHWCLTDEIMENRAVNIALNLFVRPLRCWKITSDGTTTCVATNTFDSEFCLSFEGDDPDASELYIKFATVVALGRAVPSTPEVTDIRTPGGGINPSRVSSLLEEERATFFDIAHVDGDISPEHGAVVVRVPQTKIDELGEKRVYEEIQKVLPAGVAYIIEATS
jgi:hypothetical protein